MRPLRVAVDSSLDNGRLAGAMLHRATPFDVPTVAYRLFSRRLRLVDHRQITGFSGVGGVRARSVDGKRGPAPARRRLGRRLREVEFSVRPGALTVVG